MTHHEPKRLTRDLSNKMWAGVCAGLGNYFDIDPTMVRLVWVLATFITGFIPGLLAYLVAMIIIPAK